MRKLTIFLAGSTELKDEREKLRALCLNLNQTYKRLCWEIEVKSCEEITDSQTGIDKFIEEETDVIIFIVSGELRDWSKDEMRKAKERRERTGRPAILVMRDENSQEEHKARLEAFMYGLFGKEKYYTSYNNLDGLSTEVKIKIEPILTEQPDNILANAASYKELKPITWKNDNFAYLTIETRFKENYNIALEGVKGTPNYLPYDKMQEEHVFGGTTSEQMNEVIEKAFQVILDSIEDKYKNHSLRSFLREIPFLTSEFYFYYYILYLYYKVKDVEEQVIEDPYRYYKIEKQEDMINGQQFKDMCKNFIKALELDERGLKKLIKSCVNMNSSDLSQNDVSVGDVRETQMPINNIEDFYKFLKNENSFNQNSTIQLITDNCGQELISDILLGIALLKTTSAQQVVYHIKRLPIFVSDSIMSDVDDAISVITQVIKTKYDINSFILRQEYEGPFDTAAESITFNCSFNDEMVKQLVFRVNDCWHLPTLFKDLDIFKDWNKKDNDCALIIVKGDLNYRRLVGDYQYDCSEPTREKTKYIKKALLILRSLKSNVILGISAAQEKELDALNPNWRTVGDFGIAQFINPTS